MKKSPKSQNGTDMLDEYDFRNGVRGKYAERYARGVKIAKQSTKKDGGSDKT